MTPEREPATGTCAVCGSTSARELYTARDRLSNTDQSFTIARCLGCGVLRTLPEMTDAELASYYPDDYWGNADEPSQQWIESSQSEKTHFINRLIGGSALGRSSILDVGCGAGFFLRALNSKKWDRYGVEISPTAATLAEQALGGGHVFAGGLIDAAWPDLKFDVVTLWSELEHTREPRANLKEAKRIIKRGGSLIVQLPNAGSYQSRLFGGDWFALDAPRHRYHFTLPVLEQLLSGTGFEVYRVSYFSKSHNAHALRQSLKRKLLGRQAGAFYRAVFLLSSPLIKPFDLLMSAVGSGATLTVAAESV